MTGSNAIVRTCVFALAVMTAPGATRAETAEQNYRLYCVQCHGMAGSGGGINHTSGGLSVSPRDHTNAPQMAALSDEDLRLAIAAGGDAVQKSPLMPPWEHTLSAAEIDDLIVHLRKLCRCQGKN